MASISGTMMSGWCLATALSNAWPSSMENTSLSSATCMAGALSYLSQATTYKPALLAAMTNSLPSSPEPNSMIFFIWYVGLGCSLSALSQFDDLAIFHVVSVDGDSHESPFQLPSLQARCSRVDVEQAKLAVIFDTQYVGVPRDE